MKTETKICQNCKSEFEIREEDFVFYEKIKVPPPTFCPECRMVRRMMFRNLKTFYKRQVEGIKKPVFAMIAPDSPFRVVDANKFYAGEFDTMQYGRDYDFNKPFFEQFKELMLKSPLPHIYFLNNINSEYTNNTVELKNCYLVFNSGFSENILYGIDVLQTKDSLDLDKVQNSELCYELYDSGKCNKVFFSSECGDSYNIYFSHNLINCHDCFLCVILSHKSYCILNKQYSKEEYENLVPKIKRYMDKMPYVDRKGRVFKYGEFFPYDISPYAYNETFAQEIFPLTKDEALQKGYSWRDLEERNYQITLKTEDIPDNIKDVPNSITKEIIECLNKLGGRTAKLGEINTNCSTAFKILPQELEFYRKMNIPLPRVCPNCRHNERIKQRNPLKLWKRKCMCGSLTSADGVYKNTAAYFHGSDHCPNEFETTYSPERKEIVYCKECYRKEVF